MKFIGEILEDTNKMDDLSTVIAHLKAHKSPALLMLFEASFHPAIKWMLPEGVPPYTPDPSPYGYHASNLYTEMKRMFQFLNSSRMIQNPIQREKLFVQMLESLPKSEAEILVLAKDRKLTTKFKWITYETLAVAFPGMLPVVVAPVVEEVVESPLDVSVEDALNSSEPKQKSQKKKQVKIGKALKDSVKTSTE